MHNGIVNKTKYDNLGKLMKQTNFTVKNLGGKLPKKQSTIIKRSFRPSTILVDELTVESFYHFKTSKFFNI